MSRSTQIVDTANSRQRRLLPLLLAPAGSPEAVIAAIDNGADAVYVGLAGWSRGGARGELAWDEVVAAQKVVADAGKKLHIAINTIPKPRERMKLFDRIPRLLDLGVRDVIVNDIGILTILRDRFDELRLTASIGCGAQTVADVAFFRDLGAYAVVLPGTVSPEEMREIRDVDGIRVEIMLHMVEELILLGRCWMPSYVHLKPAHERETGSMKRGGVGACFRICQQPWALFEETKHIETRLLPSRQISRIGDVRAYAEAGADILKLQGRSLPPDLLGSLVRSYRKALDGEPAWIEEATLPTAWTVVGR